MSAPAPLRRRPPRRVAEVARLAALLVGAVIAPVVGDIGSCGQEAEDLDGYKFFSTKRIIDCDRCTECGLLTRACGEACDLTPEILAFPEGCYPLIHDGEACLHALQEASCDEYSGYMADQTPTTPTECNFCPPEANPAGPSSSPSASSASAFSASASSASASASSASAFSASPSSPLPSGGAP